MTTTEHITCFTITGEFLTGISRDLWEEGRPEAGMRILEAAFPDMAPEMRLAVALGYKKLDGDSNVGITIEEDTAEVEPSEMLANVIEPYRREIDKLKDEVQFHSGQTVIIPSPEGAILVPERRTTEMTKGLTRQLCLDGDWDLLDHIPWKFVGRREREEVMTSPYTELERQKILDLPEPEPEPPPMGKMKITGDNGWLSPTGLFYECYYGGHITLSDRLGHSSTDMEKLGWMKVQEGNAWNISIYAAGIKTVETTDTQKKRVLDWYLERGKELPYWMEPDDE